MKQMFKSSNLPLNISFLYIETVFISISGYAYWLIVTRLEGAEVLGMVAAMASFAGTLAIAIGFGMPLGLSKFLGMSYANKDSEGFSVYFYSSSIIAGILAILGIASVILLREPLYKWIGLPVNLIYLACGAAFFMVMRNNLRTVFISIRRAQIISASAILGCIARIGVGVVLLLLGFGAVGAGIGYIMLPVVYFIILLAFVLKRTTPLSLSKRNSTITAAKEVVKVSSVGWLPILTSTFGSQLGVLVVFGMRGAVDTGLYFVAFAIFSLVSTISASIWAVMFPVISGLKDRREEAVWRGVKLGLVATVPAVVCLFLGSRAILGLFGSEFLAVGQPLALLLASALFIPSMKGVETFAYANGRYRHVLLIGLAANIPRVILYLILVSDHGANGAAIAYLGGSVIGFVVSAVIAYKTRMHILRKQLLYIIILPVLVTVAVYLLHLNWVIGVLLVLAVTLFGYIKLKIITKKDLINLTTFLHIQSLLDRVWPFNKLLK